MPSKPIQPFEKSNSLQSNGWDWSKILISTGSLPVWVSITSLDRTYSETQLRNNTGIAFQIDPTFIKTYTMTRNYGLNWDLTRSLKLDFNADMNATHRWTTGTSGYTWGRDSVKKIWNDWVDWGRYHHSANLTYNIPLNKIPVMDWVNSNVRYGSDYS